MKLHFFGTHNQPLPFDVCLTIFSFIPDDLSLVSTRWAADYRDKKRTLPVLPTLYTIPDISIPPESLDITQLSGGMTNGTFKVDVKHKKDESWVLRIAGKGTSTFIDRLHEQKNATAASRLGLNVRVQWFDHEGTQLTPFLHDSRPLSSTLLDKKKYITYVARLFKELHDHPEAFHNTLTITGRIDALLSIIQTKKPHLLSTQTTKITAYLNNLIALLNHFVIELTACHNDPTPTNFLVKHTDEDHHPQLFLIDWEYSSKGDFLWDLVYFCVLAELDESTTDDFLRTYFGELTDTIKAWFTVYKPLVTWWISLWSYAQIANDSPSCDPDIYLQWAEQYLLLTLDFFESKSFQESKSIIQRDKEKNIDQMMPRSF
mgnify:FL=1